MLLNNIIKTIVVSIQFKGSGLASGVYLYRLESGNYRAEKKFILLK
jgi:hypothetical protein